MLASRSLVQVLFSKYDLILSKGKEADEYLQFVESALTKRFADRLGSIDLFKIAARPTEEEVVPFAYGLDKLLPIWMEQSALFEQRPYAFDRPSGLREFDELRWKDETK
jgi:hypothetical protein